MLVKYITRKFNLLEHSVIVESFLEAMKGTPCYVEEHADYYKDGFMKIHVTERYIEEGKIFVYELSKKDEDFVNTVIRNVNSWSDEVKEQESGFKEQMDDEEAEIFLKKLFDLMLKYGFYLELTHHINRSKIELTNQELVGLGQAHDKRRITFQTILSLFVSVGKIIARNHDIEQGHLNLVLYSELKKFFRGEISKETIEQLQDLRCPRFIYYTKMGVEEVFSDAETDRAWKNISKNIKQDVAEESVKGMSVISKGIVRGEIFRITQNTPLDEIKDGKIILVEMTMPDMTPALKKAKAIITDEGGRLCHAACIAREFGVPCIVGTKDATKLLKTEDKVEIDTDKGSVKVITDD